MEHSEFFCWYSVHVPGRGPIPFRPERPVALRVSNGIAVVLLFLAGYPFGRFADRNPWRTGLAMVILGVAVVSIAIFFGG